MRQTYAIQSLTATGMSEEAQDAQTFCLRIIRDFYGIEYNSDWHADLDSLTGSAESGWYSSQNGGGFRIVRDEVGNIIATGGLYNLARKPGTSARLAGRYGDRKICQIARVYLDPAIRGKGLGSRIVSELEADARALGYDIAYLHADAQTPATLSFWASRGYREFGRFSYPSPSGGMDTSVDFDKVLSRST
ncbi:GNAT family N-acetyltransferase [Endobacterium cereale]|uniref:GNAT family N-acetyltransferase n=1 Tax=Endobacterium cereale TaxID=2663029 RepID=UPI001AD94FA9|nr:GNAT family N-acetyltransferase [Endobacterium cereale]